MHFRVSLTFAAGLAFFQFSPVMAAAQVDALLCHPSVSNPVVVASPKQRYDASHGMTSFS